MPRTSRSRPASFAIGALLVVLVADEAPRLAAAPASAARKPAAPLHFVSGHPRILITGARVDRLKAALSSPAGKRFKSMVNTQLSGSENVYGFRGHYAAFLYRLTGDASYGKYAVKFIDAAVAADEKNIAKGTETNAEFDSYLLVGERIGDVMLTYDWCFDLLSPAQKQRWFAYADQAVWNVWNPKQAVWGTKRRPWTGWSVDNPNNNYFSSFLEATMLLGLAARGEFPRAETWIKEFRDKHIGAELLPAFDRDLVGGGSREGTGYGNEMRRLFRLYDWWESATGERLADLTPQTKASLVYAIHSTMPTMDRVATIGDQAREAAGELFDSHRELVQTLTYLYRSDPLAGFGQAWLARISVPEMGQPYSFMYDILYRQNDVAERPLAGLYPVYFAPGVGHLFARSGWGADATWLGVVGGPLVESHAHRDLGSFLLFKNEWLAYDAGISSNSGLRQEEAAHNLVELTRGGKPVEMQYDLSAKVMAVEDDPAFLYAAVDVTPVYGARGGVTSVQRELVYVKPDTVIVFDRVSAKSPIAKTWHLSTPYKPVAKNNTVSIQGKKSNLGVTSLLPRGAKPAVVAWHGVDPDYTGGYRVDIPGPDEPAQFLTVLSLDGAVTRAAEGAPSSTGVAAELALKDGRTVRVQFKSGEWGGGLEIVGGAGAGKHPLKPGIARLPVLAR